MHIDMSSAQILNDGSTLTTNNLKDPNHPLSMRQYILIYDTPESIGMKIPRLSNADDREKFDSITVRHLGNIIGMDHPVTVIDVRHQDEMDGWTMGDLVEYFEDEDRIYQNASMNRRNSNSSHEINPSRNLVLNQISLEFSHTPLKQLVQSPQFVRDLDWIDIAWPKHRKQEGDFPTVQYYCLTSTAGCYTDFHVDFGGSSVWYHVISGEKVFLILPPTEKNIRLYEMWLCSKNQNNIFFLDMEYDGEKPEMCNKVSLKQGQTFIIPGGWIHAVYTPVDSIVFGGNFLHGLDINCQIETFCLEKRIRVPMKFRFPYFIRLMFYAVANYYKCMIGHGEKLCQEEIDGLPKLAEALRIWAIQPEGDKNRDGSLAQTIQECLNMFQSNWTFDDLLNSMYNEMKKLRTTQQQEIQEFKIQLSKHSPIIPTNSKKQSAINSSPMLEKHKVKLKISRNISLTSSDQCSKEINNLEITSQTLSSSSPSLVTESSNEKLQHSSSLEALLESTPLSNSSSTKRKIRKIEDLQSRQQHSNEDEEWVPGVKKMKKTKKTRSVISKLPCEISTISVKRKDGSLKIDKRKKKLDRTSENVENGQNPSFEVRSIRRKQNCNLANKNCKQLTARQRLSKKFKF